ncbi:unnamed protein product [Nesidiocoris tenuis]|uniref:RING-type E3 ubiquitin transferase n=2 Tax=Nesidiocoris tenuis TaxID=355587 RepID=A0A6H5FY70_9HEMI|nr:ring finger protein 168, E3 ubiquitin protein ligase [Nesidiocoris tenuis]CAA9994526.1 unnamed protein product [Nesidiocoris tenuis]
MSASERAVLHQLSVTEVICPLCRAIFIEPVSFPCRHTVCLECLNLTVENSQSVCPICRARIGTYVRQARSRGRKLVNQHLWEQLKKQYPNEIERKRNGDEDGLSDRFLEEQPRSSIPYEKGEVKKEFNELLNKLKIDEEESRKRDVTASVKLAQQLIEEEAAAEKLRKVDEREKTALDEQLARNIEENENLEPDDMEADSTSNDDMDMENGRDSITIEFRHFTPICIAPKTPPKLMPNGQQNSPKILKPKNLSRSTDRRRAFRIRPSLQNKASLKISSNNFQTIQAAGIGGPADTTTSEDSSPTARLFAIHLPSSSNDSSNDSPDELVERQRLIEERFRQEKADHELAMKLQRRWRFSQTPVKRLHPYSLRSANRGSSRDGSTS